MRRPSCSRSSQGSAALRGRQRRAPARQALQKAHHLPRRASAQARHGQAHAAQGARGEGVARRRRGAPPRHPIQGTLFAQHQRGAQHHKGRLLAAQHGDGQQGVQQLVPVQGSGQAAQRLARGEAAGALQAPAVVVGRGRSAAAARGGSLCSRRARALLARKGSQLGAHQRAALALLSGSVRSGKLGGGHAHERRGANTSGSSAQEDAASRGSHGSVARPKSSCGGPSGARLRTVRRGPWRRREKARDARRGEKALWVAGTGWARAPNGAKTPCGAREAVERGTSL